MALVSLNLRPSKKQLRDFGLIALCMCNLIGLLLLWAGNISPKGFIVLFLVGVIVFILSRLFTTLIKPVYLALTILTFPIGWTVSHLIMGVFYYGIVTPVAVLFRVLGRDPLCRKYDPQADSYWIAYKRKRSNKDYFHQF
jgi:hypothetical protein